MARTSLLTDERARALKPGKYASEPIGARGEGALILRASARGAKTFFLRYAHNGAQHTVRIGPYDPTSKRALRLAEARAKARDLAKRRLDHADLRGHLAVVERERAAAEAAAKRRGTLKELCDAYVAHLLAHQKPGAADVRSVLGRHVLDADAALALKPAAEVTRKDVSALVSRLLAMKQGRNALKLRTALRAAYALAQAAEDSVPGLERFAPFAGSPNPAAEVSTLPLRKFRKARTRALSDLELGRYVGAVDELPAGPVRSALLLLMLLGGQRTDQLLASVRRDVNLERRTITLRDPKGSRPEDREWTVPLTRRAAALIGELLSVKGAAGAPLFTTDGKRALARRTLSDLVAPIAARATEDADDPFQLRDLRRTIEQQFQSLGVSREARGWLMSHGQSGVQAKHYEGFTYAREIARGLGLLDRRLFRLARKAARA